MIFFPQLSTGAVAQFPFRRELQFRTLVNQSADGSEIRVSDTDFQKRVWEIPVSELNDAEWEGIQDLFVQVEGRLQSFLFLEPAANLLSWSEKFSNPVWAKDSSIAVLDGQPDPFGGSGAGRLSNSGGAGNFRQALGIPASLRYAGSIWARTASSGALLRVGDGGAQFAEAAVESDNQWKRYSVGYSLPSSEELMELRLVVPEGGTVDIYGPQLEAQPASSLYKKTLKQAGVYANARFHQDVLGDRVTGVNQHSGVVRISWTPSQT